MSRKSIDCRDFPDETGCTRYRSGEEDHVVHAAELREWLRSQLQDEAVPTLSRRRTINKPRR